MNSIRNLAVLAALGAFGAITQNAGAAILVFNFDTVLTGGTPGGNHIATLTISDTAVNTVNVSLSHNSTSAAGQFISDLWFNLDPYIVPLQSAQSPANKFHGGIVASQNGVGSAGIKFDLHQEFQTSNSGGGSKRLKPGEVASFTLTGTGLDAMDFNSTSTGNRTDVFAMIHLQGVPYCDSVKLGSVVPEPASMAALSIGALALIRRRRK